jgi:two-component system, sensor histidine kinase PdtaS
MTLLKPNTDYYTDYIDKRKFVMLWRTTLFLAALFLFLSVWTLYYNIVFSAVYFTVVIIVTSCLVYLHISRRYKPILYLYAIAGMIIVAVMCNLNTGHPHAPDFMWAMSLLILIYTTLGKRAGWIAIVCLSIIFAVHYGYFYEGIASKIKVLETMDLIGITIEVLLSLYLSGYFISQHLSFTKYTEEQMSLANAELELQNQIIQRKSDENAILIKEIHHRVKNNLQIIISLLRMHRDEVSSPEARKDFDEAINRILSMALLHQQMYMEKELSRFNLEEYITILVRDIIASYRSSNQMIETEIKVQKAPMKLESIVPLGLLINELVANSLKHAFNGQSTGKLTLVLKKAEGGISLTYSDDGTWVDSDLMNKGFGSELVEMLTEQLNGKLMRNGSTYELIIYT